jgi:colicin import membrane protein
MSATLERLDFYPPPVSGTGRALALALAAHLALVAALTWGVSWKREASVSALEAEIWSALPQQAAPKAVEAPPPVAAAPQPAATKAPDIVVEKEKPKSPPKPEPKPLAPSDPKASKAADDKKQAQQKELERQKYLERMAGLAGASGGSNATGSAMQSGGPSSSYAGIIKARVKPNLVFAGSVSGNPSVNLEIRMAPDGTILGRPRILKSSGSREWDEAVVRAFEKTEVLPRDAGRIWSPLVIDWRFND